VTIIRTRQARFVGHTMRNKNFEHLATTGKIEGKRSIWRQRIKIIDALSAWCGMNATELLRTTNDRAVWRAMPGTNMAHRRRRYLCFWRCYNGR